MRSIDEHKARTDFEGLKPALSDWGKYVDEILNEYLTTTFPSREHVQQSACHRVKSIESYCEKVLHRKAYDNPLLDTTDKVGTRIILLTKDDVQKVSDFILECKKWCFVDRSRDSLSEIIANPEMFTYQSEHFIIRPLDDYATEVDRKLLTCEIQVRTILQHAYAEISHDTIYKKAVGDNPKVKRMLASSMALIEAADEKFCQIYSVMASERTPDMEFQETLISLYKECVSQYDENTYRIDIANMLLKIYSKSERDAMGKNIKDFFLSEKEMIASAIDTYQSQSVLFRQPIVIVAFYGIINCQQKLYNEWPFSYEDFECVAHGMDISMEKFK